MKNWITFVLIFLWYFTKHAQTSCLLSSACKCDVDPVQGGIFIDCSGKSLTAIPSLQLIDLSWRIIKITFENNDIKEIPAYSFNGTFLKMLDFTNNPLTTISAQAFVGIEETIVELFIGGTKNTPLSLNSLPLRGLTNLEHLKVTQFHDQDVADETLKKLNKLKSLTLSAGNLNSITASAFSDQSDLELLDLSENKLKYIPSQALSSLPNLVKFCLSSNKVVGFEDGSFEMNSKLKILNLERMNQPIINKDAFRGLENSLEELSLKMISFSDSSIGSIIRLRNLIKLDLSYNRITLPSKLLDGSLTSLKTLNLQDNQITRLDQLQSSKLEKLTLENNPISEIFADSFQGLPSLSFLNLKNGKNLKLDENTFKSQSSTLTELWLNGANLTDSNWSFLSNLKALKILKASECSLSNIPEFALRSLVMLQILELNSNGITSITQRSLTGLSELTDLSLSYNRFTTLDECTFNGLNSINMSKLKLDNNPLVCDCNMQWLHRRIKDIRSQPGPNKLVPFIVMWKCDNINIPFTSLSDENFSACPTSKPPVCESYPEFTSTKLPITTPDPVTGLSVSGITSVGFHVHWVISLDVEVDSFVLSYAPLDADALWFSLSADVREQYISNLSPVTTYNVSITVVLKDLSNKTSSITVTTRSWWDDNKNIVAGALAAVFIVLVLIILTVVCVCLSRRKTNVPIVEITEQSKRFVKNSELPAVTYRPLSQFARSRDDPNYIIKSTLDSMSEEEKYKLVNLLTNSRGSLNDLDERVKPIVILTKHIYEEIPNDIYDEIPEDKTV